MHIEIKEELNIKEINKKDMGLMSGAGNYPNYPKNTNDQRVINCNSGIIGGMIAGSAGGIPGLTLGLIGSAFAGGCFGR